MLLSQPFSFPSNGSLAAVFFHRHLIIASLLRPLSTAAAVGAEQLSKPHFMVDYLINSCGLSSAEASKAAFKYLSHLKSTEKPDSFLAFMRSHGFHSTQLRRIILRYPGLICSDVEKTLAPKFQSLESVGFIGLHLASFITSFPRLLKYRSDIIQERVVSTFSLLRNCGIEEEKIALVVQQNPRSIFLKPEKFSALVEQVERMGIPRSSGMFIRGLLALTHVGKERFAEHLNLMKSFGWSEADFFSAFCKSPNFMSLSKESLSDKMDFLVKEVGLEPLEVAAAPKLLTNSFEKRLVPRHRIMKILSSRKLLGREYKLTSFMKYSDKVFVEKYVTPYKDTVPELEEIEMVSCGRNDAP